MKKFFSVSVQNQFGLSFQVYYPASLDYPKNNSVMFVNAKNVFRLDVLNEVSECVIFVPSDIEVSEEICMKNSVIPCDDPRMEYCLFYRKNRITYYPPKEAFRLVDGAFIADTAVIGENVTIMPGAYISGETVIGNNVYIGSGARLVGKVTVGDDVVIRENSVIGADGLSTDRDSEGKAATMPQFGGVEIQNGVQIGALTVIARGAIDNTVIGAGTKIDNSCFISHNVRIGDDTFIVGETIMFGGSSTGKQAFISGNATIRNKAYLGAGATVGMGAVVTRNVPDGVTVLGNPAKER